MLPVGNEPTPTSWAVATAFLKLWIVLALVGLLFYVALSVVGVRRFAWVEVAAIACVVTALALLLTGGPDGWSATYLKTRPIGGVEVVGSAHEPTPWRAVQRAAWQALQASG